MKSSLQLPLVHPAHAYPLNIEAVAMRAIVGIGGRRRGPGRVRLPAAAFGRTVMCRPSTFWVMRTPEEEVYEGFQILNLKNDGIRRRLDSLKVFLFINILV